MNDKDKTGITPEDTPKEDKNRTGEVITSPEPSGMEGGALVDSGTGKPEKAEEGSKGDSEEELDLEHYSGYDHAIFEAGDPSENVVFSPNAENALTETGASPDPELSFVEFVDKTEAPKKKEQKKKIKYKTKREKGGAVRSVSITVAYIAAILVIGVLLGLFLVSAINDVFAFVKDESVIEITIDNADMTVSELAELLHSEGLIKYPQLFKLYVNIKKHGAVTLKTGTFKISPSYNYDKMLNTLNPIPPLTTVRITFKEGITTDEVIEEFVKNGIGTYEGFREAIENGKFDYWFLEGLKTGEDRYYRLDGYLYPDTYEFYSTTTEEKALNKLLKNFGKKFSETYKQRLDELGLSVDQLITIASMIEWETNKDMDYEFVSAVFHNRIKSDAFNKFESDATVQCVLAHEYGGRHDELTAEDLEIDSPYNTRKSEGFPPGPICNPSLSAIKAAMYPNEECGYFYFVADNEGYCRFATTLKEHQQNIRDIEKEKND